MTQRGQIVAVAVALVAVVAVAIATGSAWIGDADRETAPASPGDGGDRRNATGSETAPAPGSDSADRLIFWAECDAVASLSDVELDDWKAQGIDGFVCMGDRFQGLGGSQDFTGDPDAELARPNYDLQRSLRDSRIVQRAAARELKLYLGAKLGNYSNTATPLADWFDDAAWSQQVLPRIHELAAAAHELGFAGVAFDQELYPQVGGVQTATWSWDYPGNTHTEAEVRAQAKLRGAEVMRAILEPFPGAELAVYHFAFPGDWQELVEREVNGVDDFAADLLHIDFWDGMTSVEGYSAVRFWDNTFYKAPHRGSWESALTYNQNATFAALSSGLENWDYASKRVHVSPFSWIDSGPNPESDFDDARPPGYVREQLLAFRKWGTGGEFANYVYGSLTEFDYAPYADAIREASSPANLDHQPPTLVVTAARDGSSGGTIAGTARDNLAVRAVRWRDDRGGAGAAALSWTVLSGDYASDYEWEMRWSIPAAELTPGATQVTITVEDIKGNSSAPVTESIS